MSQREANAIYQRNRYGEDRLVARVADVEVDETGKEILFGEISQSDDLILADKCEYGNYIIVVRRIAYATKEDKSQPESGRVLRGVRAEILARVER